MKKNTEKLIYDICTNEHIDNAVNALNEMFGECNVEFIDEGIDEGDEINSTEDETYYVMMRNYKIGKYYVVLYYSDFNYIVDYVRVSEY